MGDRTTSGFSVLRKEESLSFSCAGKEMMERFINR